MSADAPYMEPKTTPLPFIKLRHGSDGYIEIVDWHNGLWRLSKTEVSGKWELVCPPSRLHDEQGNDILLDRCYQVGHALDTILWCCDLNDKTEQEQPPASRANDGLPHIRSIACRATDRYDINDIWRIIPQTHEYDVRLQCGFPDERWEITTAEGMKQLVSTSAVHCFYATSFEFALAAIDLCYTEIDEKAVIRRVRYLGLPYLTLEQKEELKCDICRAVYERMNKRDSCDSYHIGAWILEGSAK
jgi:hypothetical protein